MWVGNGNGILGALCGLKPNVYNTCTCAWKSKHALHPTFTSCLILCSLYTLNECKRMKLYMFKFTCHCHLLIMSPQDTGWSSLFFSAEAGHVATTQSLLRAGANPHLKDKVRPLRVVPKTKHLTGLEPKPFHWSIQEAYLATVATVQQRMLTL